MFTPMPPPPLPITTAEQTLRIVKLCERYGIYFGDACDWLRYIDGLTDQVPAS